VSRTPPRDPSQTFEWPPSPGDLSAMSVMQVGQPAVAPTARSASRVTAAASSGAIAPARGSRRRPITLQQLTLLAAGMLVGAALPGIDDGRRPIVGIARAAEAATVAPALATSPIASGEPLTDGDAARAESTTSRAKDATPIDITAAATPVAVTPARAVRAAPVHRDPRTRQVLKTLRKYEAAFSRMDASATSAVWPSANHDELTRGFTAMREQRLWLHGCTVSGSGLQAAGTCRGTLRYRPRVGDHSTRLRRGTWRFALEQSGDGWLIRRVASADHQIARFCSGIRLLPPERAKWARISQ